MRNLYLFIYKGDDALSEEEVPESPFAYHPSEEDFKESDLEDRKRRRYLMGAQSFLKLKDPRLENALKPGNAGTCVNCVMDFMWVMN
jgi:hypothetical protein